MRAESEDSELYKILQDIGEGKYPEIYNSQGVEIPLALWQVVEDTDTSFQSIYEDHDERSWG